MLSFNSYGEIQQDYYSNGQIKSEWNYKDGIQDGKWTFWHEDGQVKRESNYKDGVCLSGYCIIIPPDLTPSPCNRGNWKCNEGYIKSGNECKEDPLFSQEVIEREIAEFEAPLTQEAIEKEIAEFEANLAKELADFADSFCM